MFFIDPLHFVVSVLAFALGFVIAVITVILLLLTMGIRIVRRESKAKPAPKLKSDFEPDEKSKLSLNWLNRLVWIAYPRIISKQLIEEKLREVVREVPKNVTTISSIDINNFKFYQKPPSLNDLRVHDDGFGFQIDYEPNLVLNTNVKLNLPYLSNVILEASFIFHEFHGNFNITISKDGILQFIIDDATNLDFDIKAGLKSKIAVDTQQLESVWATLKQWINTYIHQIAVSLSIKELINFVFENQESKQQKFPIVIGPKKID